MIKKTILCYGDSITWGYDPAKPERMKSNERWTGLLKKGLGASYTIIEEGLNGRITIWDDPQYPDCKNGLKYLEPCLNYHKPIDLCILFLGTNDLKKRFSLSAFEISYGIKVLVEIIQKSGSGPDNTSPKILLMTPPYLTRISNAEEFKDSYNVSYKLPLYYSKIAENYNCEFIDTSKIIVASKLDGIHPDVGEHLKLAKAVYKKIKNIMI
ncbi:MAG: SGNH/GDSL hydrolase family protein [Methanobacterium sp.]|nr:SGNH/GDSL hydrolase family protein [Methanobacterium sp.]